MAEALIERLDQVIEVILARGNASAALADAELAPLALLANDLRSSPSAAPGRSPACSTSSTSTRA